ncbi:MAG: hypothetical protein ACI8V4_003946, partial [Ilumatobacter sp.]
MRRVTVPLGGGGADRSYPVIVGNGVIAELPDLIPETARRVAVVTQ